MTSRTTRLATTLVVGVLAGGLLIAPTASTAAPSATATSATAPAAADQTLDVLVLGDSYSAGNGATDDQGAAQTYGPAGCERSRVNWGEKYAAGLRATGRAVRLVNHACSGGVTADITSPRAMTDVATKVGATPAGVTTPAQADAHLAQTDPCNTRAFPDEEFWTYRSTNVNPATTTYTCTRNLRPQADFVTPDTDLVLFTMGGNDAGFSTIVQYCFLLKDANGCKTAIDSARALLPQIGQRLVADVTAMRAHGLRDDAKIVQLGYPLLQVDNGYTLPGVLGTPGYDAGTQIRAFGRDGNAASSAIVPTVNTGHPGQLTFLTGVPEKFAGHEPDAATPAGNPARWINQAFEGPINVWYHPNRLGQIAYADLLLARGTFGAPTGPPTSGTPVRARLKARFTPRRVQPGDQVHLRVRVTLSDRTRPRGKVTVRGVAGRTLITTRLRGKDRGTVVVTFRVPERRTGRIRVVYRDRVAPTVRASHPVRWRTR
jgi:lysophospholipase L1-like esterase